MSEYFESIENITMRYETLAAAQADLRYRVDTAQQQCEDETAALSSYVKHAQNDLLVKNSEIADMCTDLDKRRFMCTDNEAALHKSEIDAKESVRALGEIKMAIQNIYGRCVRKQRSARPSPEALDAFLDAIKDRVTDLQAIVTAHEGPCSRQELEQIMRMRSGQAAAAAEEAANRGGKAAGGGDSGAAARAEGGKQLGAAGASGGMPNSEQPSSRGPGRPSGSQMSANGSGALSVSGGPASTSKATAQLT